MRGEINVNIVRVEEKCLQGRARNKQELLVFINGQAAGRICLKSERVNERDDVSLSLSLYIYMYIHILLYIYLGPKKQANQEKEGVRKKKVAESLGVFIVIWKNGGLFL